MDGEKCQLAGYQTIGGDGWASVSEKDEEFPDLGFQDMVEMRCLSDAELNRNLNILATNGGCYCMCGPTLVSLNTFYTPAGRFSYEELQTYCGDGAEVGLDPHCYSVANRMYTKIKAHEGNQALVITGESGAGKTYTTNKILDFFAGTQSSQKIYQFMSKEEQEALGPQNFEDLGITSKMTESTPILESFGNAKMPRNDDSSRFGKIYKVFFDQQDSSIVGCDINPYLLEKSRIVTQASGERGYHIYYELLAGLSPDQKAAVKLDKPHKYYVNMNPEGIEIEDDYKIRKYAGDGSIYYEDDAKNCAGTIRVLNSFLKAPGEELSPLGFTAKTLDVVKSTSAVMQMGNIEPHGSPDQPAMVDVCALFGVDPAEFAACMKTTYLETARGKLAKGIEEGAAKKYLAALTKFIYNKQFLWLIEQCSILLRADPRCDAQVSPFIGILDIFGFEYVLYGNLNPPTSLNSFEQFCINLCNEKLQKLFVDIIFDLENQLYQSEGLGAVKIAFSKNDDTLAMLEGSKNSVCSALDDKTLKASRAVSDDRDPYKWDNQFLDDVEKLASSNRLNQIPGGDEVRVSRAPAKDYFNKKFGGKATVNCGGFLVKHYAATVLYDPDGWCDKNIDKLTDEMKEMMSHSTLNHVAEMFEQEKGSSGKTTVANFKAQLNDLVGVLNNPHISTGFVRCIKANRKKIPRKYEADLVLTQLSYTGMLDTLKIQKGGYASRIPHTAFWNEFRVLYGADTAYNDYEALVKKIEDHVEEVIAGMRHPPEEDVRKIPIHVGKVKFVLTRDWLYRELKTMSNKIKGDSAVTFQAVYRGFDRANKYRERNDAVLKSGFGPMIRGTLEMLKYLPQKYAGLEKSSRAFLTAAVRATMMRQAYYTKRVVEFESINRQSVVRYMYATLMRQRYYELKDHFFLDEKVQAEADKMKKFDDFGHKMSQELAVEMADEEEERTAMRLEEVYLEALLEGEELAKTRQLKEEEQASCGKYYYRGMEAYQKMCDAFEADSRMAEQTMSGETYYRLLEGATEVVNEFLVDEGIEPSHGESKWTAPALKSHPADRLSVPDEAVPAMKDFYYGSSRHAHQKLAELEGGKPAAPALAPMLAVQDAALNQIKSVHNPSGRLQLSPTVPRQTRYVSSTMTSNVDPKTLSPHQREAFQTQIADLLKVDPSHVRLSMSPR